jgi:hypothetical protein
MVARPMMVMLLVSFHPVLAQVAPNGHQTATSPAQQAEQNPALAQHWWEGIPIDPYDVLR